MAGGAEQASRYPEDVVPNQSGSRRRRSNASETMLSPSLRQDDAASRKRRGVGACQAAHLRHPIPAPTPSREHARRLPWSGCWPTSSRYSRLGDQRRRAVVKAPVTAGSISQAQIGNSRSPATTSVPGYSRRPLTAIQQPVLGQTSSSADIGPLGTSRIFTFYRGPVLP
jgi:hypothetical protein